MSDRMRRIHRIHFVGIGGSGMSGIAEVLVNLGYEVQGSDLKPNPVTDRLAGLGARIMIGHAAQNVGDADVVVTSSAVSDENPEVVAALGKRIPVVPRAEMLGELMRFRYAIAVAGTHGKTTTTSLTSSILAEGGEDPTFVIGGRLKSAGTNARLGAGKYLVAEADESDASFLHLNPMIAIVTNIDNDHLGTHHGDFEQLKASFVAFLHNLPFYGLAVLCVDDPHVRAILPKVNRPVVGYGFSAGADLHAENLRRDGLKTHFDVVRRADGLHFPVTINLPGVHNVLNSLAAISVALEIGIPHEAIQRALANFQGIDRRLTHVADVKLPSGGAAITIVDDYGHHPTEIAATLDAIRQGYPGRRVVLAFQPHRYTRTRDLLHEFAPALAGADELMLTDIYAAGEQAIAGVDAEALLATFPGGMARHVARDKLPAALAEAAVPGDLVLCLGAGDITGVPTELITLLEAKALS